MQSLYESAAQADKVNVLSSITADSLQQVYGENAPFVLQYYLQAEQRDPGYIVPIGLKQTGQYGLATLTDPSKNDSAIYPLFWDVDKKYTDWIWDTNTKCCLPNNDLEIIGLPLSKQLTWLSSFYTLPKSDQRNPYRFEDLKLTRSMDVNREWYAGVDVKYKDNEVPAYLYHQATYKLGSCIAQSWYKVHTPDGREVVRFVVCANKEYAYIPTVIPTTDKKLRRKYHGYFIAHYTMVELCKVDKLHCSFMANYPMKHILNADIINVSTRGIL